MDVLLIYDPFGIFVSRSSRRSELLAIAGRGLAIGRDRLTVEVERGETPIDGRSLLLAGLRHAGVPGWATVPPSRKHVNAIFTGI